MTRLIRRIGFALYVVIATEIALQAFYWVNAGQPLWRRTAVPIFAADGITGFWNKRNLDYWQRTHEYQSHLITNADGLRVAAPGVEYRPGRAPSRYRLLLLGPSFTFGWGVDYDQSVGHVLETILNGDGFAADRRVEVINAGVPFMSARQSFDWYERKGAAYAPDLVILFTYGSLDIADDYGSERMAVDRDGYLVPRGATPPAGVRGIAKNSALAFYGWLLYGVVQERGARTAAGTPIEGAGRTLSTHAAFSPDGDEAIQSLAAFRRGSALSAASGARYLVVYLPAAFVVHREDLPRWREIGTGDVDAQIEYDRGFCDYLTAHAVDCVNLTPDLASAAQRGTRQYYRLDAHWTPAGHATAARAIARRLLVTSPNTW